jgi:hypothetical protein
MFIKVHVRIIDDDKFEEILKYYNENKPKENEPLERLRIL